MTLDNVYVILHQHEDPTDPKHYVTSNVYHVHSNTNELKMFNSTMGIPQDVFDHLVLHYGTESSGLIYQDIVLKTPKLTLNSRFDKTVRYIIYKLHNVLDL